MREHPWHIRRPTTEHYQRFKNLVDLHQLTSQWLKDLNMDEPSPHQLKRIAQPGFNESLEILQSLTQKTVPTELENFLDDAYPEELLEKLQQSIWVMQAWTLRSIMEQSSKTEWSGVWNILEQSSWKQGRQTARQRWNEIPEYAINNLRGILAAFQDSPLSGYPINAAFLVKRAIANEIELELLSCPHQNDFTEVKGVADELCRLHTHFMRGYVYHLNTLVLLDYQSLDSKSESRKKGGKNSRCRQRWYFHRASINSVSQS